MKVSSHDSRFDLILVRIHSKHPWQVPVCSRHHGIQSERVSQLLIHATGRMDLKVIMLSKKKVISKCSILYDFTYIIFLK